MKYEDLPNGTTFYVNAREPKLMVKSATPEHPWMHTMGYGVTRLKAGDQIYRAKVTDKGSFELVELMYYHGCTLGFLGKAIFRKRPPKAEDLVVVAEEIVEHWHPDRLLCNLHIKTRDTRIDMANGFSTLKMELLVPTGVAQPPGYDFSGIDVIYV